MMFFTFLFTSVFPTSSLGQVFFLCSYKQDDYKSYLLYSATVSVDDFGCTCALEMLQKCFPYNIYNYDIPLVHCLCQGYSASSFLAC